MGCSRLSGGFYIYFKMNRDDYLCKGNIIRYIIVFVEWRRRHRSVLSQHLKTPLTAVNTLGPLLVIFLFKEHKGVLVLYAIKILMSTN